MAKSKTVWEQIWRSEQPLFKHYSQTEVLIKHKNIVGNNASQLLIYSEKSVANYLLSKASYKEIQDDGKKLLNPKTVRNIIKNIKITVNDFWKISKELRKLIKQKENFYSKKFINSFKEFDESVEKVFAYFRTTWEATSYYPEERLKKILKSHFLDNWEEKFMIMVTATEIDLVLKEKISWLKVLEKPLKKNIQSHMLKFPFLFGDIDSEKDSFRIMAERLKHDSAKDVKAEINASRERLKKIKLSQQEIFGKIKSKEAEEISFLLQQFSLLRMELKNCWQGIHFYLFSFFNKMADLTKLTTKEIMTLWSLKDIINFLENNIALSKLDMQRRYDSYLLLLDQGKMKFYISEEAKKLKKNILEESLESEIKEFKGNIANKGKVEGVVKVINFNDLRLIENMAKSIKDKFILVTGMTNPNMVPLIKKAKGIITDEGGVTCHAAILSREFNVPCIIGTRVATRVLKDGDLVEVDANKGIVRILK